MVERVPRLGAVVLHHRHWPDVREAIEALLAEPEVDQVVVVDNDSGDGSGAAIAAAYPEIGVIEAPANRGYAAGMNLGADALGDVETYLFLTHECVVARGAVAALVGRMRAVDRLAMVGPLLGFRSAPERVWSAGGGLGRRTGRPFHLQDPAEMAGWPPEPREVEWIDGAAMLVRATAFRELGGFDEGYFMYDEELDLALRARRSGWSVECFPRAVAWQEPGMAPPYLQTRNRLLLLAGTPGLRRHLPFAAVETVALILGGCLPGASRRRRRGAWLRFAGVRDALRGRLDRVKALERP